MEHIDPSIVIDALGGSGQVARRCGITSQAVSRWRKKGIPRPWLEVFRRDFPELFAGSDGSADFTIAAPVVRNSRANHQATS